MYQYIRYTGMYGYTIRLIRLQSRRSSLFQCAAVIVDKKVHC